MITNDVCKNAEKIRKKLILGKKLCPSCRQRLQVEIKEGNYEDWPKNQGDVSEDEELSAIQKYLDLEEDLSDVSDFFSLVGVSPIKHHAVSTAVKTKQGKRKLETVVATLTEKVARCLDIPVTELRAQQNTFESSREEIKKKVASFD